jgi:hypothetical protein
LAVSIAVLCKLLTGRLEEPQEPPEKVQEHQANSQDDAPIAKAIEPALGKGGGW